MSKRDSEDNPYVEKRLGVQPPCRKKKEEKKEQPGFCLLFGFCLPFGFCLLFVVACLFYWLAHLLRMSSPMTPHPPWACCSK